MAYRAVDLRHIRYFVASVDEGSLQAAASRMNVAQPALSRRIRDLEDSLGCSLLERSAQGVRPTAAGVEFYRDVLKVLEALDEAWDKARRAGRAQTRVVRLGLIRTSRKYAFAHDAIAAFKRDQPQVSLEFTRVTSAVLSAALRARQLDMTLVYEPYMGAGGVGERLVHREQFVLSAHPEHPLARPEPVRLDELAGVPLVWLTRSESQGLHDVFIHQFRRHGVEPVIAYTASSYEELMDLTIATGGVCLTAASTMLSTPAGALVFRPISDLQMHLDLKLSWRLDIWNSPAAVLLKHMNASIDQHQAQIRSGENYPSRLMGIEVMSVPEPPVRTSGEARTERIVAP